MTKHIPTVAGALLGLAFIALGLMFLLNMMPKSEAPPAGSPVALFMGAIVPTGYMTFVKVLEVLGGVLVAIPRTRNLGLLVLGPIIVNILAFHIFLTNGAGLKDPALIVISLLAVYLLWVERKAFCALVCRN
jgi:putative oxidoreductase